MSHVHGGDIYRNNAELDFSINCSPEGMPEGVKQAIVDALELSEAYPDTEKEELRRAIAAHHGVDMEDVYVGNGAAEVIFSIVWAVQPKEALVPMPTFAEYEQALEAANCSIKHVKSSGDKMFVMGDEMKAEITESLDIAFFCNPNNPTGVLYEKSYVEKLAKELKKVGALLVLDECFLDFTDERDKNSLIDRLSDYDNLIILRAFTKLYSMAGIRLGYAISKNHELLKRMREITQPWNVSTLAQHAGIAALKEKEYVERNLESNRIEREALKEEIAKLGYEVFDSKANYIFFKAEENLYEKCLKEHVLIRDCSNYTGLEKGYFRVAVRSKEDNEKLMRVLKKIGGKIDG